MWIPEHLYSQILDSMPIPCVDLLVRDQEGQILLLFRNNAPAKDQWWFPGGRVHWGETRAEAAKRKLMEECGLEADEMIEAGTFDLLLPLPDGRLSHAVTTVFEVHVAGTREAKLDQQSSQWRWLSQSHCAAEAIHPFIRNCIDGRTAIQRA